MPKGGAGVLVSAGKNLPQISGLQLSMGDAFDLCQSFNAWSRMCSPPKPGCTTKCNGRGFVCKGSKMLSCGSMCEGESMLSEQNRPAVRDVRDWICDDYRRMQRTTMSERSIPVRVACCVRSGNFHNCNTSVRSAELATRLPAGRLDFCPHFSGHRRDGKRC